jgi:hypothetical protein
MLFEILNNKRLLEREDSSIQGNASIPFIFLGMGQDRWFDLVMMGAIIGIVAYQILYRYFNKRRAPSNEASSLSLQLNQFSFERTSLRTGLDQVVVVPATETIENIMGEIKTLLASLPSNERGGKPHIRVLLTGVREGFKSEISKYYSTTLQSKLGDEDAIEKEILVASKGKKMLFVIPIGTDLTDKFLDSLAKLSTKDEYKNNIQVLMLERILNGAFCLLGTTQSLLDQLKTNRQTLSHA